MSQFSSYPSGIESRRGTFSTSHMMAGAAFFPSAHASAFCSAAAARGIIAVLTTPRLWINVWYCNIRNAKAKSDTYDQKNMQWMIRRDSVVMVGSASSGPWGSVVHHCHDFRFSISSSSSADQETRKEWWAILERIATLSAYKQSPNFTLRNRTFFSFSSRLHFN